jgi:polysaccharide deacetylase family protein (PEP-CTERM system associated)
MKNAITIDLEDYYQVTAFSDHVLVEKWDEYPSRIEHNTATLLSLLEQANARATFFTLGWVARKYPTLVRQIADNHHEIACHSNVHRSVFEMDRAGFREDTAQAKKLLEDTAGKQVSGYRAPSFSIKRNSLWAYEVLAELGFRYDSSIFPIRHPSYGWPRAPRFPFSIRTPSGPIMEFPLATLEMGGARAPIGGGAYFRLLPYWYTSWALRYVNLREARAACVYLHPWELDSAQPRMRGNPSAWLRHYFGLGGARAKLSRLLAEFAMQSLESLLGELTSPQATASGEGIPEINLSNLESYLSRE